jgi:hypothetical protein
LKWLTVRTVDDDNGNDNDDNGDDDGDDDNDDDDDDGDDWKYGIDGHSLSKKPMTSYVLKRKG